MAAHSSKSIIYAALAGNALTVIVKFAAAWFTGSSAMLSEAIHSTVDTGNQLLVLHGLRRASKPATPDHPFGYGLELYFWVFMVAMLIFGLGAVFSIFEGLEKIATPRPIENVWVSYAVLGLGMVFEGTVWIVALSTFRATKGLRSLLGAIHSSKDPTIFAVLFEDTAALLGLVVAMLGIALSQALDLPALDGAASLVIGLILAATALLLAYECKSLLTGESVNPEVHASIRSIAIDTPGVVGLNEVRTMHFGPRDVLVVLSLDFEDALPAGHVEKTVSFLQQRIKGKHTEITRVFIEAQSFDSHRRTRIPDEVGSAALPVGPQRLAG